MLSNQAIALVATSMADPHSARTHLSDAIVTPPSATRRAVTKAPSRG